MTKIAPTLRMMHDAHSWRHGPEERDARRELRALLAVARVAKREVVNVRSKMPLWLSIEKLERALARLDEASGRKPK